MLRIAEPRLIEILHSMQSKTIMVLGDLMLDEFIEGTVERISPEAPVPVVLVHNEYYRLGGAGNVANNLMSLGAKVVMASVTGSDDQHMRLEELLRARGIATDHILADPGRRTIVKTRLIAEKQQVARVDREDRTSISAALREELLAAVRSLARELDAIIISDYGKGVVSRELIEALVSIAHEHGVMVNVDPKERNFPFYLKVDLITPNTRELSFGAGIKIENDHDLVEAASKVKSTLHCRMVLVTRGEQGMSLFGADGDRVDIPTAALEVYDVTGAGDTVISCLTLAMAAGATPIEAATIANVAAGQVVAVHGTAHVQWDDLYRRCMENIRG